jgi:hypothetical protein
MPDTNVKDIETYEGEISHLEEAGATVSDALDAKEQENAALRAELAELEGRIAYPILGEPAKAWPSYRLLQPVTLVWILVPLTFCEWEYVRVAKLSLPLDMYWFRVSVFRSSIELLFLLWSVAVWKTEGFRRLFCCWALWGMGWVLALFWVSQAYPSGVRWNAWVLSMLLLSNWWGTPIFHYAYHDLIRAFWILCITADATARFRAARFLLNQIGGRISA